MTLLSGLLLSTLSAQAGSAPLIINGGDATIDEYPNTGGLIVELDGYGILLMCSSTLIAPDTVMVAAHCLDPDVLGGEPANIGWSRQSDLSSWGAGTASGWPDDVAMASDWVAHEGFDYYTMGLGLSLNSDIGLVFLDTPVTVVAPAVLPTTEEAAEIAQGDEVVVVGWGYQDADLVGELGVKQMGISDLSELADYEFQVGKATSAVRKCHGDSGGPSFRTYPDSESTIKDRVIGVTSHTYDLTDCQETGGVDTRVDYFLDWIDTEMSARCADSSRSWCDEPGILAPPVPKSHEELMQGIELIGCATGGSARGGLAALALVALALGRRSYRPAPSSR